MDKNIQSWHNSDNSSSSNFDYLVDRRNIRNLLSDKTFLVRDSKSKSYSIYFAIENNILEIENDHYIYDIKSNWNNNINSCIESYLRSQICIDSDILGDSVKYNDSDFNSDIFGNASYLESSNDSVKYNDSDFNSDIFGNASYLESSNDNDDDDFDKNPMAKFKHLWVGCENEDCYGLNYKQTFKEKMNICEHCGYHLKMSSSDRIELLIDPGTWNPMDELDEYMVSVDPIEWDLEEEEEPYQNSLDSYQKETGLKEAVQTEWDSEEEPYQNSLDSYQKETVQTEWDSEEEPYLNRLDSYQKETVQTEWDSEEEPYQNSLDSYQKETGLKEAVQTEWDSEEEEEEEPYLNRLDSYQKETGLKEAVQTGTGQLNGIPLAIGIMEFQFMGGSMGSVVGEKITRLIEYATNQRLPLILVCASGGARMQEGSLSLMQMAKISSALYNYQINQKLFYVPILTSPTTGGVTASFGMLGDIIIAEPNAYIAFAGKRVIEQTLNKEVPEGSQSAEVLFEKGLLDSIVPRKFLKEFLTELFQFHGFVPLTQNEK